MKSQKIRKTLKKHMRHMEQCASLWLYTDDGEAIHQLRVEYKKMRALIRLERLGTPAGRKITIPRNLKKLYKNAGEVRSLQIYYRSVVLFFENAHGYRADILQQIDVAKSRLYDERDAITGNHSNPRDTKHTGTFSVEEEPIRKRYTDVPEFVTVKGGAYFFLPGIKALTFLASI